MNILYIADGFLIRIGFIYILFRCPLENLLNIMISFCTYFVVRDPFFAG